MTAIRPSTPSLSSAGGDAPIAPVRELRAGARALTSAQTQFDAAAAHLDLGRLGRVDHALVLVEARALELGELRLQVVAECRRHGVILEDTTRRRDR